jgi:hypothetical protein
VSRTWGLFCYLDTPCFLELTKLEELVLTCTANDQHFYCSCLWICFIWSGQVSFCSEFVVKLAPITKK